VSDEEATWSSMNDDSGGANDDLGELLREEPAT
jgi:hypothetical protein